MKSVKTELAVFVKENYKSYAAFARAVNGWCEEEIFPLKRDKHHSMTGAVNLQNWGSGECKPHLKHTLYQWRKTKEYIKLVHGENITDRWLSPLKNCQEEIRFTEEPKNETDDKKCFEKAFNLEINTDILEDAIRNIKTERENISNLEIKIKSHLKPSSSIRVLMFDPDTKSRGGEVLFDSESQSEVLDVIEFLKKNAYERLKNALHTLESVKEDIKKML